MASSHIKVKVGATWKPPVEHKHGHGQGYHSPVSGNGCALGRWLAHGIVCWEMIRSPKVVGAIWGTEMIEKGHWACDCPL